MSKQFESRFKGRNNNDLFFQSWVNETADRTIVVTHGLAEHSECYTEFANEMLNDGYNVYAWDLQGHGRSEGKRGYIADFQEFVTDMECFIDVVRNDIPPQQPIILFGHSMGGLITLLYHLKQPKSPGIQALCLSSPALGYAVHVSSIKDTLAKLSNRFFPTLTLYNEIRYSDLTHDQDKLSSYPMDSLRHDKVCAAIYLGMMESFDYVFANAKNICVPTLFQLAGQDCIVSTAKSKNLFERIDVENKLLEIYADSFHEIFNDQEREICFKDLKNFLRMVK